MGLEGIGKLLLLFGGIMVLLGLALIFAVRIPFLGRLPGDIFVQKGNISFYFPWVTFLLLSLVLTVLVNLVVWLLRR